MRWNWNNSGFRNHSVVHSTYAQDTLLFHSDLPTPITSHSTSSLSTVRKEKTLSSLHMASDRSVTVRPCGDFRYEAQVVAGLDAFHFSRANWIQGGTVNPFEYEVANKYGFLARIDNYSIKGLRIGVSGYYGQSMHNSVPHDMETGSNKDIKGNIYLGALDFTFNRFNWIARGNVDYGYISDAATIGNMTRPEHNM